MTAEAEVESQIKERSENAEIFLKAIDLVVKETSDKVTVMEMSDVLLAVGFDMLYHIISHAMPGGTAEQHSEAVSVHIDEIKAHLEKEVWSQL